MTKKYRNSIYNKAINKHNTTGGNIMALAYLFILFIVMAVVSGLGLAFLYLFKNEKIKNGLFYFLAVWSMGITYMNVTSLPTNYLGEQLIAWAFGFLAVLALIIKIKKPEKTMFAHLLVTASILCGMTDLFFF